ncbi:MAG: hypothetical protein K8F91_01520, partial [Candidatus Obscuribacterales bacterium]|nr:hypothetical protein [Candidatus Obscuribacterales bacterium]
RDTVEMFGGNACQCPKKGGWISYLVYASSEEPNLAFMIGHPFDFRIEKSTILKASVESGKGTLPWQQPQDVIIDVLIEFKKGYQPYFLPLKTAYGLPLSREELENFEKDPDSNSWKGFTLRLRPSLEDGSLARPEDSKGIKYKPKEDNPRSTEVKTEPDFDDSYVYASVDKAIKEALGEKASAYLHPMDPGEIINNDGTKLTKKELEKLLPRLKSTRLRLHIVRRGQLKDWTVYHFALMNPVLAGKNGFSLPLKDYRPKIRKEKWNSAK